MILTFYSQVNGGCTSSNTLAIAMQASLSGKKTVLVDLSEQSMSQVALIGKNGSDQYYENVGIDAMLRNVVAGTLEESNIFDAETEISPTFYYISPTVRQNKELYLQELKESLSVLVKTLEYYHDIVILDMGKKVELFEFLCNIPHLRINNLPQNIHLLEKQLQLEEKETTFFMIGNYDDTSRYTIRNLKKKYHITITGIMHNSEFFDSIQTTELLKFFYRNENCDAMEHNYSFMEQCKLAFSQILKNAERRIEKYGT